MSQEDSNQQFAAGEKGGLPPWKEGEKIDLKIAHWCLFGPRTSGMYETVRELIFAENQIEGVLAGMCSTPGPKAPKHVVKKEAEGGRVDSFHPELRTQDWGWARKWADVHIIHSTMASFLKDLKPKAFFHHGCFYREQLIKMADGSSKPICKVKVGDMVLSYNHQTNKVEGREVTWAGKNGKTSEWIRIIPEYGPMIMATKDHPIFTPTVKMKAGDLKEGDLISGVKPILSDFQRQIFLGKNLGDGYCHNNSLEWSHKKAHSEYNDLILKYFKGFDLWRGDQVSGYGSEMDRVRISLGTAYRGINPLEEIKQLLYENDSKIILDAMLEEFDWPALAVLYYDDGNMRYVNYDKVDGDTSTYFSGIDIAMCSYEPEDVEKIAEAFKTKFSLDFKASNSDYPRLHLYGKENLARFMHHITKNFPVPKCMEYKIWQPFRSIETDYPDFDTLSFTEFENRVMEIDMRKPFPRYKEGSEYTRWALTVEGNHNYYAGVNLVSNTPEACISNDLERGTSSFMPAAGWTRDFELSFVTSTRAEKYWGLFDYTGHKVKKVQKGIDLDWWTRSPTKADLDGEPSVLYGEIWRGIKHPFHTLYAIKELHERRPEVRFNPWGLNIKKPFWQKLVERANFDVFIGKWGLKGIVDYPEHYYSRGDVLVRPGLYGDQSRVGMEAMACGCPTIGWDSDPYGDAKLYKYAKAFDVSDLSYKIEEVGDKVLDDRAAMAKECRELAEKHMDIHVEAEQIVGHLREMINEFKQKYA